MSDQKFAYLDAYVIQKNAFKAFSEKIDQKIIQMRKSRTEKIYVLEDLKKREFDRLLSGFLSSSQDFQSMMAKIEDKSKYGELRREWNAILDEELRVQDKKVDDL
jgi:hypothetical protein